jgi:hypothetical protein
MSSRHESTWGPLAPIWRKSYNGLRRRATKICSSPALGDKDKKKKKKKKKKGPSTPELK